MLKQVILCLKWQIPEQRVPWKTSGGPTPENYKATTIQQPKTPGGTLKQVKDVVNKGAKAAEPMKGMKEEEELETEATIEESEESSEEVVEEETIETPEYNVEEDVNAPLVAKNSPRNSRRKQRPSSKQQSTLRLLLSKKNWLLSKNH